MGTGNIQSVLLVRLLVRLFISILVQTKSCAEIWHQRLMMSKAPSKNVRGKDGKFKTSVQRELTKKDVEKKCAIQLNKLKLQIRQKITSLTVSMITTEDELLTPANADLVFEVIGHQLLRDAMLIRRGCRETDFDSEDTAVMEQAIFNQVSRFSRKRIFQGTQEIQEARKIALERDEANSTKYRDALRNEVACFEKQRAAKNSA